MNVLFSIIVPVYNVEKYLRTCIESVINQNYFNWEMLLIDDGSQDNSPQICDSYSKIDNRIRVLHKENGGLSDARNTGLENAKGDYIVFIDSDDWIATDSLFNISKKTSTFPDIVITEVISVVNEKEAGTVKEIELFKPFQHDNKYKIYDFILNKKENIWPAQLYIVKKEFIDKYKLRFWRGFLHEDVAWTSLLLSHISTCEYYNRIWYIKRKERNGSITNTVNIKRSLDVVDIANNIIQSKIVYGNQIYTNKWYGRLVASVIGNIVNNYSFYSEKEKELIISKLQQNKELLSYALRKKDRVFLFFMQAFGARNCLDMIELIKKFK